MHAVPRRDGVINNRRGECRHMRGLPSRNLLPLLWHGQGPAMPCGYIQASRYRCDNLCSMPYRAVFHRYRVRPPFC